MNTKLVQNLAYFGSNEDICRALGCSNDKIIKYSELANYTSLLQLLPKSFDYIIILIENDKKQLEWLKKTLWSMRSILWNLCRKVGQLEIKFPRDTAIV